MQNVIDKCFVEISKEVVKKDGKLSRDDITEIDKLIAGLESIKVVADGVNKFEGFKRIVKSNS